MSPTPSIAASTAAACFAADLSDLALPKCHYTRRVQHLAVRLVAEDGLPYQAASWHLWRDHRVFVPYATIQNWVEAAGEKKVDSISTTYLDEALADFSGYLAIDEVYDGPFCILSRRGQPQLQPPGLPGPRPRPDARRRPRFPDASSRANWTNAA